MAAAMCLGLLQQSQSRVAWADMEPEVEVPDVDEAGSDKQCYQSLCSDNGHKSIAASKSSSRNTRTRRCRRKAQGESIASTQTQKPAALPQPTPPVSRSVDRNVVTWSDLMDCSDTSPASLSQASTATSSPTPSPPLSARMPCYAGAADSTHSIAVMVLPGALSSGNLGPLLGTSAPSAGGAPGVNNWSASVNPAVANVSACTFGTQRAHPQGGLHGKMHVLYQDLSCLNASSSSGNKLEALLYEAAQTPYED
eukprot:TRINITY_DN93553_c0_g1_i1.p1 TRINITY_DN93553_c0_g1~~TRINITY_DN93553_c0_g1_i1.p1  ORF type:complete len:273 (-),score=29.04 TRINITY_DN93553_c0_g1_i1:338-1096(-)